MKTATGQQLADLLSKHIGEPYVLGTFVPKDDANYKGAWDCAEFISWGIFQVSGILYGCLKDTGNGEDANADAYTGYWDRDAHKLGKIITVEEAARTPGAALLRVAITGECGHIVCSMGDGRTVEAHGHADGVIHSVVSGRRWDYGILVPGMEYETKPVVPIAPDSVVYRLTQPMMTGRGISVIQAALNREGFPTGVVDGIYGVATMQAVKSFQNANGLMPDGEVGPKTLIKLHLNL